MDKSFAVASPLLPSSTTPTATTRHPLPLETFRDSAQRGGRGNPQRGSRNPRETATLIEARRTPRHESRGRERERKTTRASKNKIERDRCATRVKESEKEKESERERERKLHESDVRERKSVSDALFPFLKTSRLYRDSLQDLMN